MKVVYFILGLMAVLASIGGLVFWGIAIYQHAPYAERTYWMMFMVVMGMLSDHYAKKLDAK